MEKVEPARHGLTISKSCFAREALRQFRSIKMEVTDGFKTLLSRIEPTDRDIEVYESHRQSITRRLETVFSTNKVELIGSYARGSSIRATSDIDLLLILKREEVRWGEGYKTSSTVLDQVRAELLNRYPATPVGRDVHAITVGFADNQHPVDVVPGFYLKHGGAMNYPIYAIPNGQGGWMATSPQSHNKFINDSDNQSGGKLKRVARLIKFWRRCRTPSIPLNSFHVELFLAQERICVGPMSYALCMNNALAKLANRQCQPLDDPMDISGKVPAAYTEDKRRRAQEAIYASAKRAYNALQAEGSGNVGEALRLWDLVFNGNFPKNVRAAA